MSILDACRKRFREQQENDDDEDRPSKVGKGQPMVPTQDPFGKVFGKYVIYLCCDEPSDSAFTAGLELCRQNCSVDVHKMCFQQDRTRHISLWEGKLTDSQVREIQFTELPDLPTVTFKQGWHRWTAGNYIEVNRASVRQLKEILGQLRSPLPKGKVSCDHLSLYRKRRAKALGVKDVDEEFERVRRALASHEWGTLEGVSIRIKQVGTPYDQCKVLAGCLYIA
jgi:hypothetical protein